MICNPSIGRTTGHLLVAAIILLNTVSLDRAINAIKDHGLLSDDNLMQHLFPLGWEHINLTGDYLCRQSKSVEKGQFRQVRPVSQGLTYSVIRFVRCPLLRHAIISDGKMN